MSIGQDLLNVPMGDMIRDMAFAIADGQFQLDQSGMRTAEMMGGLQSVFDESGKQTFDDSRIFFGYEYMTVRAALAHAIFDDSLTGSIDADTIKLADVVRDIIKELPEYDTLSTSEKATIESGSEPATPGSDSATTGSDSETTGSDSETTGSDSETTWSTFMDTVIRVPTRLSMMELGFTPTFYQFVDTIIEVKIAIKMTRSFEYKRATSTTSTTKSGSVTIGLKSLFQRHRSVGFTGSNGVQTTQVDASYSSKYSYSAEGASLLRTKMTPVPPPAILEERIRSLVSLEDEMRRARFEKEMSENEAGKKDDDNGDGDNGGGDNGGGDNGGGGDVG